jgi:beta-phosphoglucomutase-like phosphatase (HAD superfamily)
MNPAFPRGSYEALIFDCDGTLTDSMPLHYLAWSRALAAYGFPFPEERFYALGGVPSQQIVRLLADERGVQVDVQRAAEEKEAMFMEMLHLLVPIDLVVQVVKHFVNVLPMAVASGGYRHIINRQLDQIGCTGDFQAVVTAEDTVRHKPNPEVFLLAAEKLEVPANHCLVYEDSSLGIDAAKAAGMDYIDIREFHRPRAIRFP